MDQCYRFTAGDAPKPDSRAAAISLAAAGDLAGSDFSPSASRGTIDLLAPKPAGAYVGAVLYARVTLGLVRLTKLHVLAGHDHRASRRPGARSQCNRSSCRL